MKEEYGYQNVADYDSFFVCLLPKVVMEALSAESFHFRALLCAEGCPNGLFRNTRSILRKIVFLFQLENIFGTALQLDIRIRTDECSKRPHSPK